MRVTLTAVILSIICCNWALADDPPRVEQPGDRKPPEVPQGGDRRERVEKRAGDPTTRPVEPRGHTTMLGGPFDRITNLTDEQKAKLLEIRRKYEELLRKQQEEMMAVLTEEQRREFAEVLARVRGRVPDGANPHTPPGEKRGRDAAAERGRDGAPEPARDGTAPAFPAIITKVEVPNIWIQPPRKGGEPTMITADEKTLITVDGKAATFADLKIGQHVNIERPEGAVLHIDARSDSEPPPQR